MVVDRAYRGRGLGAAIVASLLDQLSAVDEVFLNTRAHLTAFYARHGFELFGGQTMKRSHRKQTAPQ